jgi:hypothetical protein
MQILVQYICRIRPYVEVELLIIYTICFCGIAIGHCTKYHERVTWLTIAFTNIKGALISSRLKCHLANTPFRRKASCGALRIRTLLVRAAGFCRLLPFFAREMPKPPSDVCSAAALARRKKRKPICAQQNAVSENLCY